MDWLKLIESTQHCQRNWDFDKVIDEKTIDWLFDVGYTMPTKQNKDTVQIVAFKSREIVELVSKHAYDRRDIINHTKYGGHKNNPQTNAPLLFGFIPIHYKNRDYNKPRIGVEIGLAAGAIALAANSIGMKTGFCQCFEAEHGWTKKETLFLRRKNIKIGDLVLLLGIGYPIESKKHNIDNTEQEHPTYDKLPVDEKKIIF